MNYPVAHRYSQTGKMPCKSWSLNATDCITGRKLMEIPGTTCSGCYANRNFYLVGTVRDPRDWNMAVWRQCAGSPEEWVNAHVAAIRKDPFFRWFDSGDVQSLAMLRAICRVAELTPNTKHWLPTKERGIVLALGGTFPANLTLRVSAQYLNAYEPFGGLPTASVESGTGTPCSAVKGKCGPCRDCWNSTIDNIDYKEI